MELIHSLDKWHKTKPGFIILGVVELGISYGFASLSIDRGNFLWYILTLVFFIGGIKNIARFIRSLFHGK